MQATSATKLRRVQIREILQRHEGSIGAVARDLNITIQAVSMWLGGRSKSKRVAEAAERKALALLDQENGEKKRAGAA
jgi:DNA-binding transcriptional regulator YiaG